MPGLTYGTHPCACPDGPHRVRRVALTGGPGAGKTAVLEMAGRVLCRHTALLPESASIVFSGGFPRRADDVARRAAQRAIFYVQRQIEWLVDQDARTPLAICDRGTVDGLAYWPGEPAEFYRDVGTDRASELGRYVGVVHLRVPPPSAYNHQNPLRVESPEEARRIDDRIFAAWSGHPRRIVVEPRDDFLAKAHEALVALASFLPECCRGHVAVASMSDLGPAT